jgi:hypothetical protein
MIAKSWTKPLALLILVAGLVGVYAARGRAQQRNELRDFMKQKLALSQAVLAGLTREEYTPVARAAKGLKELSEDAQWRVSPNVNYLRLSSEFQDLADRLQENAKERDLDGATLAYVRLTINCIECHKLVRNKKLIGFNTR